MMFVVAGAELVPAAFETQDLKPETECDRCRLFTRSFW
jgi:hypothetical protein